MPSAVLLQMTGEVDSVGSSSSLDVQVELRQAVQLAAEQQQQLEALRDIVQQQNRVICRVCERDATLGLELRQTSAQGKDARSNTSHVKSSQPAARGRMLSFSFIYVQC